MLTLPCSTSNSAGADANQAGTFQLEITYMPEVQYDGTEPQGDGLNAGQYSNAAAITRYRRGVRDEFAGGDSGMAARRMRFLGRALVPAVALSILAACNGPRTSEVRRGDRDYPTLNSHPKDFIQITAHIPATLKVEFLYGYSASPNAGGLMGSGTSCQREVDSEVAVPLFISTSLPLTRSGDGAYRGTVAVDRFEPGRCDWTFDGISFLTVRPRSLGDLLVRYEPRFAQHERATIDVWCIRAKLDPTAPELCGDLSFLSRIEKLVSAGFLASVPKSERARSQATIGPDTKSVDVTFHDLNALSASPDRSVK